MGSDTEDEVEIIDSKETPAGPKNRPSVRFSDTVTVCATPAERSLSAYCEGLVKSFFPVNPGEEATTLSTYQYGLLGRVNPISVNIRRVSASFIGV